MSSNISHKQNSATPRSPKRIALIIISCIVGALILLDLSPLGGNYRMYSAWVQCGQKPVAAYDAFGDKLYYDPTLYSPLQLVQPNEYYCSADKAGAAGYRPSISYETYH